jgi:hypothetical protein
MGPKGGHKLIIFLLATIVFSSHCKKSDNPAPAPPPSLLRFSGASFDHAVASAGATHYNVRTTPAVRLSFDNKVDRASVAGNLTITETGGSDLALGFAFERNDSVVVISPSSPLKNLTRYLLKATTFLQSAAKGRLNTALSIQFITQIDSSDKFPVINDAALLDTIQRRTFRYFWEYGHPVSGLARERSNATPETVTSGGSGFGIMTIPVAVSRNFITRSQGLQRMQTIVSFLKNNAQKFHGAFPHWLNGTTGAVIPFSPNDDGADLVETSFLMAGLLAAREFFNQPDIGEVSLRNDINDLWNAVEWNWFRQNGQQVLYWHWSPNNGWLMNHKIEGWNECLITYLMAAASASDSIPPGVYQSGFARAGAMINGNSYYGYTLPLGPPNGGPLFWSHYSFLGINPNGLSDAYANYQTQVTNHTRINYEYCKANPGKHFGYSRLCWGLTASDVPGGYNANEPNNDIGVISPTAAISSIPYTPAESMDALKFFYYKLGDRIFGQYGFVDAFSLKELWFANSYLAIDQGPIIIMIENYRSQLVWNLLSGCPEIKRGLKRLGFSAPYL